jgi:hypothetical protein
MIIHLLPTFFLSFCCVLAFCADTFATALSAARDVFCNDYLSFYEKVVFLCIDIRSNSLGDSGLIDTRYCSLQDIFDPVESGKFKEIKNKSGRSVPSTRARAAFTYLDLAAYQSQTGRIRKKECCVLFLFGKDGTAG